MDSLQSKLRAPCPHLPPLCFHLWHSIRNRPILVLTGLVLWFIMSPLQLRAISASSSQATGGAPMSGLISIRLVPEASTLRGKGSTQQFAVLASFADGEERDLTAAAQFSLTNPKKARLLAAGRIQAVSDGETELIAEVGEHRAETVLRVQDSGLAPEFSFERSIGEILTRRGCNGRECHGGVKGQGGLKFSVNAAHPRQDYQWIVRGGVFQVLTDKPGEPIVSRINPENPATSRFLLKPTLAVPHGGGLRLEKESDDYKAILAWIRRGAAFGREGEPTRPKVVRLEVLPKNALLETQQTRQLIVTGVLSDDSREDLTHRVHYESSTAGVASVSSTGLLTAHGSGETTVKIRGAGYETGIGIGVVGAPVADYPKVASRNFIDQRVFAKLRRFNIIPSRLSEDGEFLRRVCLDLTGSLPPPNRVREFLADRDPRKREKLVEVLLGSPEYVDYWTFRFADLFRVAVFAVGINPKWTQAYWEWIRDAMERNRPYDEWVRERIAAQGYSPASRHYLPYLVIPPPENMMGEQVRVFMGRRLDCAQCHDHPYEPWSQDQFWGLTAFFGSMFKLGGNPQSVIFDHPGGEEIAADVPSLIDMRVLHPRTKQEVQPTLLDGTLVPYTERNFPRRDLALWMTSHDYFAEASVNRIWSHFFGRGIVDPVDDFGSNNPATHPELLKDLAKDFSENGYDLQRLFRLIVNSRTYQLSSNTNDTNREDRVNYSHALPRPLDAEVLLDAICDVTGVGEIFSTSLPDAKQAGGRAPRGTRAVQLKETDIYYSTFLDLYGRPNRFSVPERDAKPNLSQALHLLVGSTYNDKLWAEGARAYEMYQAGAGNREIIETLYLAGLSRFPLQQEMKELEGLIEQTPGREQALRDLQWALVGSREFAENH